MQKLVQYQHALATLLIKNCRPKFSANLGKHFYSLTNSWFAATPVDTQTLWPVKSIVNMDDIVYTHKKRNMHFKKSVKDIMNMCDLLYTRMSNTTTHKYRHMYKVKPALLHDKQRKMLVARHGKNIDLDLEEKILFWYGMVSKGTYLSIPPTIVKELIDVEIFGTAIDTCAPVYCSNQPLEKEYLGAIGTYNEFFDMNKQGFDKHTVLLATLPQNSSIIDKFVETLMAVLGHMKNTTVLVVCPVWDGDRQKELNKYESGIAMPSFTTMRRSRFFVDITHLAMKDYIYYNYYNGLYKYVNDFDLITLSSIDNANSQSTHIEFVNQMQFVMNNCDHEHIQNFEIFDQK